MSDAIRADMKARGDRWSGTVSLAFPPKSATIPTMTVNHPLLEGDDLRYTSPRTAAGFFRIQVLRGLTTTTSASSKSQPLLDISMTSIKAKRFPCARNFVKEHLL